MTQRVSVVVPSRLRPNPMSTQGGLYLDRCLTGISGQGRDDIEIEMIVGVDKDHPTILERHVGPRVKFVEAGASQAEAVNRAMEAATGNFLAICEDDDLWDGGKLELQLPFLETGGYDFASCNQREVDEMGNWIRVNNFATPSGWVMKREVWEKVGGFDEGFRYHVDTEWLGRANAAGVKRVHVVPHGTQDPQGWLRNVGRFSALATSRDITEPMVHRFVTDDGGMASISSDMARLRVEFAKVAGALEQTPRDFGEWATTAGDTPFCVSMREHKVMADRNGGGVPW